jgi:hypothetical protein
MNSGLPNIPGKLIRNIFGGDLGGPIIKDKLFFFGNYEGTRLAENAQVSETAPTASYQQGMLTYTSNGNTVQMSPSQVATMDSGIKGDKANPGCAVCDTTGYPHPPGPNPNALAYFNSTPAANGVNLGDGYNTGSFSFSSPNPKTLNTSIARIDYIPSDRHRIFARGNLQKDTTGAVEQYPGQGPASVLIDNTKGMTFGDTWTISPNIVNDIRYGYVRQGNGSSGIGQGDYVDFRFISAATAETRSTIVSNPLNNIVDNLNWTKGKHSIEIGGNWRLVHQNRTSDNNSYNSATSNPYWLKTPPPLPNTKGFKLGLPAVDVGFANSYEIAYANLVGDIPQVTDVYNYKVTSVTSGSALSDGQAIDRHFKANEFEYYIQDSWHPLGNLTLTFGLRHTILQTPYETKGQQVTPTIDTHTWFLQREASAQQGQVYEPDLQFAPAGPVYGRPGFWPKSKNNIAPRFAVAYSPDSKTSIRAGFGVYYDHYGEGLVNTFDQNGSFGLSTAVSNPAGVQTYEGSPRYTGRHTFPAALSSGAGPTTQTFPFTAPQDNFAITWGIDSKLKTPYSEAMDFSVQRELPKGFSVEVAYVGRLGRHLLQSLDLAEPVDLVDPAGGGDYYSAAAKLSKLTDQNGQDPTAIVPSIPFFEHIFPYMAGTSKYGPSATQGVYSNEWAPNRATAGATTALADIDFFCGYPLADQSCPQTQFWQDQFSSLYALSTIGTSYYNAGQVTLHHPMSHGLQADISYTYSRSIDMGSDAERSTEFSDATGLASSTSDITTTWNPSLMRGVSDFNTTHLLTLNYVYQLPFGRGQAYLGGGSGLLNALVGGWQLSGILHASSGLPFSLFEPGWTTDWQIESYGVTTGKVKMRRHFDANGNPQFFDNPDAINAGVATGGGGGGNVRLPYPGEAGQRNNFIGDGYFSLDDGLTKSWKLADLGSLKFAWEVYNVTNTVRFDPASIGAGLTGGNLGVASSLLTQPRRMQFSLRYDF